MDKNCLLLINHWPKAQTPLREALDMASTLQIFGHKVNVHITDSALLLLEKNNLVAEDTFSMMQELGVEFSTSLESYINFSRLKPSIAVDALKPEDTKKLMQAAHFVWTAS